MLSIEYLPNQKEVRIPRKQLNVNDQAMLEKYAWSSGTRYMYTHFLCYDMTKKQLGIEFDEPRDLKKDLLAYNKFTKSISSIKKLSELDLQHAEAKMDQIAPFRKILDRIQLNPEIKLTTHQKVGILFLYYGKGGLLGDQMGLGKTLTSFGLYETLRVKNPKLKLLYITKVKLVENVCWDMEFMMPHLRFCKWGTKFPKKERELFESNDFDVLITNLDKFRSKDKELGNFVAKNKGNIGIIVDECTSLKCGWDGSMSQMTGNFMKIVDRYYHGINFRIGISGTPLENNVSDIHNLFTFVNKDILGSNYQWFVEQFCDLKYRRFRRYGKMITQVCGFKGAKNIGLLKKIIRHAFIKREHTDVPEFNHVDIPVFLTDKEKREYDAIIDAFEEEYSDMEFPPVTKLINQLQNYVNDSDSKKQILLDITEKRTSKDIIFMRHIDICQKPLKVLFAEAKLNFLAINGNNMKRHGTAPEIATKFKEKYDYMLATDCMKEGHNWQFANRVIHYELPYTKSAHEQRNGRVRRIGQEQDLFSIIVYVKGSIEEDMLFKMRSKGRLSKALTDELYKDGQEEIKIETIAYKRFFPKKGKK